jgi:ELWxxDGT repeat protein
VIQYITNCHRNIVKLFFINLLTIGLLFKFFGYEIDKMKKIKPFAICLLLILASTITSKSQDFKFIDSCSTRNLFDIDTLVTDNDKLYYVFRDNDTVSVWVLEDYKEKPVKIISAPNLKLLYVSNDSVFIATTKNRIHYFWFFNGKNFVLTQLSEMFFNDNAVQYKYLCTLDNKVFFTFSEYFIWVSDGSVTGTKNTEIKIPNPSSFLSLKYILTIRDKFLFITSYFSKEKYLFATDGTPENTKLIVNYKNSNSFYGSFGRLKDLIFTFYSTEENGKELYTLNIDSCKLILYKEIEKGPESSKIMPEFVLRDSIFFLIGNSNYARELWKTDGNPDSLTYVTDIFLVTISNSTSPSFVKFKDRYFFDSDDDLFGIELWVTDGTKYGTYLFNDLSPGVNSSAPMDFYQVGDKMFFSATDGVHGRQLWVTDGTKEGTKMLRGDTTLYDIYPVSKYNYNDMYYYSTSSNNCLYRSDGTQSGTYPLIKSSTCYQPVLCNFITFNNNLYFSNCQVWTTDGTVENTKALSSPDNEFEYKVDTIVKTKNSLYVIVPIYENFFYPRKEIWRIEKPTQVEEHIEHTDNISVFPNPAGDYISVIVGANGRSPLPQDISIYNILGECVMVVVQNLEPLQIDISALPPGVYTINCGSQFAKFVKM